MFEIISNFDSSYLVEVIFKAWMVVSAHHRLLAWPYLNLSPRDLYPFITENETPAFWSQLLWSIGACVHAGHACIHHVSHLPLKLTPWLRLYLRRCFRAFSEKVAGKSGARESQLWFPVMQICCFSFCLGCNNIRRTEIMLWACSCLQSILKDLLANSEAKACSFLLNCIYTVIYGWWRKIGQTYWIHTVFLFLKNDLMPLNIAEVQWGRKSWSHITLLNWMCLITFFRWTLPHPRRN